MKQRTPIRKQGKRAREWASIRRRIMPILLERDGAHGMTQRSEVLRLLEAAGTRGVCVSDVPVAVGYCLRNRVGDLAKEGHRITSVRCTVHPHRGNVVRYFLEGRPQVYAVQRTPQGSKELALFRTYGRRGNGV